MKRIALFFISIYRKYLSGLKGSPTCRFYPTCSAYTYGAIEEWGFFIGFFMGLFRLLRCNPLFRGGIDHVPLRGAKKRSALGYTIYYSRTPEGYAPEKARSVTLERARGTLKGAPEMKGN